MHPCMGVSSGARNCHKNVNMQPRNGICDKIENYISELSQWSVWRTIILGQFLSIVLYWMTQLNHHINTVSLPKLSIPTGQNLPHYVMLCLVYTTWMSCRGAGNGLISVLRARGWRYLLLAFIDVEANTLITSSHQFTSLASIQVHLKIESASWSTATPVVITALIFYCITQFVFFSLVPVILFESGATALQLFLLTADFFNVLLGMLTHQYKFHTLYFLSYTLTMTGIFIYAIKRTPMSSNSRRQQQLETPAPDYRRMSHPDGGEVEMATSSGMSAVSGPLDGIDVKVPSIIESERETMDAGSLPISVSSDTAFTSFYGSQSNL
ncbi:GSCOCG00003009001-RA-CDS [Cotesia congregata]|nr:GSCOCG00003009001-RA-CDS [Cotesia congregata]